MKYLIMASFSCFSAGNKRRASRTTNSESSAFPEGLCRRFSLAEIKAATNNFHDDFVIGKGRFGKVYRGCIDDGATLVAVKRSGRREFMTELQLCCQLKHPNLVPFKGFCYEENEMILVHEYMTNGNLSDHLIGSTTEHPLPWRQRLEICIGAARGLHYLHAGAKHAIVHHDVKASIVLLDGNWVAKLSNFGLAKMGPPSTSKALIRVRDDDSEVSGTYGYLEPEYAMTGELTEKSDVYSFGVLVFVVLSGRKVWNSQLREENVESVEKQFLTGWVLECLKKGYLDGIIDPHLKGKIAPECLKGFLEIAERCVFRQRMERPAMGEVEVGLESALELQETADSKWEVMNPGLEIVYTYQDLSYCPGTLPDYD